MKISEKTKSILEKWGVKKVTLFRFFVSIIIASGAVLLAVFSNVGSIVFVVVLSIFFLVTWWMAGVVVFRSLFAASVGLTILLYLAQLYCQVPIDNRHADSALQTLLVAGVVYVGFIFLNSLWKEVVGDKEGKSKGSLTTFKEMNEGKRPWIILIPYAIFIGLFVYQLWQVLWPILNNFCVPF